MTKHSFYTEDDFELPDPLECEHKWEDDDDYDYQEGIEYCSKCGLARCIHDWGFYAQKVGDEYKHVCIYCGETKELGDRCKSGEHCYCDTGHCCWCGLSYPKKWIHHPEEVTTFINHYNRIAKRVRDVFNMEVERLSKKYSMHNVEFGEWGIDINGKDISIDDTKWLQRKDIDFSDMKNGRLWINYWQSYFGESDQDSMEFPLKVLCNNEKYEEWLEDKMKEAEQMEKDKKKAEKERKKQEKQNIIDFEKKELKKLLKKYPELAKRM